MNKKILLIEDEAKLARFVELSLNTRDMRSRFAMTAERDLMSFRKINIILYCWILCSGP